MLHTYSVLCLDYQWRLGGEEVIEAAGRSELRLRASRELAGTTVTCRADSEGGQGEAVTQLEIHCKLLYIIVHSTI